ncbi:hypothetical protein L210DRAFT_3557599 [Boletus edulis BED1]|uniref:F-box domain-containing protein n=1 Tax=Boletus edulis BED1 TaxID=1328754 RepID=A0AAD4BJX8_BOLED|nr:hypothetical protein L210DRAFT_3557599 [Boletus edulis BED1]
MDDGFGEEQDKASGDVPHTDQLDAKTTSEKDTRARDDEKVHASDDTGSSATAVRFAFVVSYVCQHWRNVALSTPSLWTTIVVTPKARPPYERVSTMLERGQGFPIDISVRYVPDEDGPDKDSDKKPPSIDDNFAFLFAMLIPHIHRWRTMKVTVSDYHHMYAFIRTVSDPAVPAASRLTTLELYDHGHAQDYDIFDEFGLWDHFTMFGGSAPLLTRIVLCGLTSLPELLRPCWDEFTTILRNAPTLQKLNVRPAQDRPAFFMEPSPPADLNVPIQLVRVTDLKFIFPALENLVLHFAGDEDYTQVVQELARPVISSSPTQELRSLLSGLENLKIAGLPCRTECVQTLYGELQNLVSLDISMSRLDPLFLDILSSPCTLPGRGGIWLPRLTTLYVSGTSGSALREVVSKRKEVGVPLDSLYVEEDCDMHDEDVAWLKENVEMFEFFKERDDDKDLIGSGRGGAGLVTDT